jgi:hypothetical protein
MELARKNGFPIHLPILLGSGLLASGFFFYVYYNYLGKSKQTPKKTLFQVPTYSLNFSPNEHNSISISLNNILIKKEDKEMKMIDSMIPYFEKLLKQSNCFFLVEVENDNEETEIRNLLSTSGLYKVGLNEIKVLFCSSAEGRAHMVKQIGTKLHIDANLEVHQRLSTPRLGPCLLYINTNDAKIAEEYEWDCRYLHVHRSLSHFVKI